MSKYKLLSNANILAYTIGLIYLWFGAMKFFIGVSPAEGLAENTIKTLTFDLLNARLGVILLALIETTLGLLLIINVKRRLVVRITLIHMLCTFTPFLFFPQLIFGETALQLTLLGQYIFKNVIIIAAMVVLYRLTKK